MLDQGILFLPFGENRVQFFIILEPNKEKSKLASIFKENEDGAERDRCKSSVPQ